MEVAVIVLLLELPDPDVNPPLPGATDTKLGIARVMYVVVSTVVVIVTGRAPSAWLMKEAEADRLLLEQPVETGTVVELIGVETEAVLVEELQIAFAWAMVRLAPESGYTIPA